MTSWKTTVFGSLTAIGSGLLGINFVPQLHGIIPDAWVGKTMFIGFILTVIGPALMGAAARDNNVTSEQAGLKPPESTSGQGMPFGGGGVLKLLLICLLPLGAMSLYTGCAKLDLAGVYHGDSILYHADLTIGVADSTMHTFMLWEYKNHEALKKTPKVNQLANKIRLNNVYWINTAIKARDDYALLKTDAGKNLLYDSLKVLTDVMAETAVYIK